MKLRSNLQFLMNYLSGALTSMTMDLLNGILVRMPRLCNYLKKEGKRTNILLDWFKIGQVSESGIGEAMS